MSVIRLPSILVLAAILSVSAPKSASSDDADASPPSISGYQGPGFALSGAGVSTAPVPIGAVAALTADDAADDDGAEEAALAEAEKAYKVDGDILIEAIDLQFALQNLWYDLNFDTVPRPDPELIADVQLALEYAMSDADLAEKNLRDDLIALQEARDALQRKKNKKRGYPVSLLPSEQLLLAD